MAARLRISVAGFELGDELGHDLDGIAHDRIVCHAEDGRCSILVDGNNRLGTADSRQMLDSTRNANAHQELRRDGRTRLTYLVGIVEPAGLHERARATELSMEQLCQALHEREILLGPDAPAHDHEPLCLLLSNGLITPYSSYIPYNGAEINPENLPAEFWIDWIRLYQKPGEGKLILK